MHNHKFVVSANAVRFCLGAPEMLCALKGPADPREGTGLVIRTTEFGVSAVSTHETDWAGRRTCAMRAPRARTAW